MIVSMISFAVTNWAIAKYRKNMKLGSPDIFLIAGIFEFILYLILILSLFKP